MPSNAGRPGESHAGRCLPNLWVSGVALKADYLGRDDNLVVRILEHGQLDLRTDVGQFPGEKDESPGRADILGKALFTNFGTVFILPASPDRE